MVISLHPVKGGPYLKQGWSESILELVLDKHELRLAALILDSRMIFVLKLIFSKKATKIEKIFTVDLTLT